MARKVISGVLLFCLLIIDTNTQADLSSTDASHLTPSLPYDKLYNRLFTDLKNIRESPEEIQAWSRENIASLRGLLQKVTNLLKAEQQKSCKEFVPENCTAPLPPTSGGLVCVTINDVRYCKPMCNQGYDFNFLRRSRLYEQCGDHTSYKWFTQFIGGSKLAVCFESRIPVSGAPSAYFPKEQDCEETVQDYSLEKQQIDRFVKELKEDGITGEHNEVNDCLLCG
ncbi:hypothetical protein AOXY_G13422 [Acipenser oxyrinchus oxyrinchus]|uniref:Uncharacterized protein n=1 Tax=Acipenser oxyrinchus oxyrinchus TaxID=40147 RepID=A0AAD8DDH5_ACIOX|nr:hypothetical protein AOXY_G13422 [Acipenser oxyrinchus oxyrinchus]